MQWVKPVDPTVGRRRRLNLTRMIDICLQKAYQELYSIDHIIVPVNIHYCFLSVLAWWICVAKWVLTHVPVFQHKELHVLYTFRPIERTLLKSNFIFDYKWWFLSCRPRKSVSFQTVPITSYCMYSLSMTGRASLGFPTVYQMLYGIRNVVRYSELVFLTVDRPF